jgi:hypothetical protein
MLYKTQYKNKTQQEMIGHQDREMITARKRAS